MIKVAQQGNSIWRQYKNFMVKININKTGLEDFTLIKWNFAQITEENLQLNYFQTHSQRSQPNTRKVQEEKQHNWWSENYVYGNECDFRHSLFRKLSQPQRHVWLHMIKGNLWFLAAPLAFPAVWTHVRTKLSGKISSVGTCSIQPGRNRKCASCFVAKRLTFSLF